MTYSGKSTLGPMLAKKLNLPFKDFRDLFYETYKITENEFLTKYGAFSNAERSILTQPYDDIVISLSGSCVYHNQEMRNLKGTVIYLNPILDILQERRNKDPNKDVRPILYPPGINSYTQLYHQRKDLYPMYAHHIININTDELPEDTLAKVMTKISP